MLTTDDSFDIYETVPEFDRSLMNRAIHVFAAFANITVLSLSGILIDAQLLRKIAKCCRRLGIVSLVCCEIADPFNPSSQSLHAIPWVTSLKLCVHLKEPGTRSKIWSVLRVFRNVANLMVYPTWKIPAGFTLAHQGVLFDLCNPFIKVHKLHLEAMEASEIVALNQWIAAVPAPLPLTHFKLSVVGNFSPVQQAELIGGLRKAPQLQVLALDGIIDPTPELISDIAVQHEALVALTLILRDSYRQSQAKLCVWPGSTW